MKTLLLALLLVGCAQTKKQLPLQNLVLIQGVHVDGTVWNEVTKRLNANSFNVINLERIGRDSEKAASLKDIATQSCQKIPMKSTVVAHSYGGAIVNSMTGICPDKIQKIIYISAVVPLSGEKPFDLMNKTDKMNYSKVVTFGKYKIIPKEAKTFFQTADATINSKTELPMLHSEWMSLSTEDVVYDEAKFNAIPKAYIYTEKDMIISLTTQFQYTSRTGIRHYDGIPTGHYPMLSNPERLSVLIKKWAQGL